MSQLAPHKTTWFLLGREPLLSAAELFSLLDIKDGASFRYAAPFFIFNGKVREGFINQLGGTIKIAIELGEDFSEQNLLEMMKKELSTVSGKIIFGISLHGKDVSSKIVEGWGKKLKKELKTESRSVRYVFNNETNLSSVTVEKNGLTKNGIEFIIRQVNNKYDLARTVSVQPFESFGARDFGRPGRDSESGMLPPKLALMLYNLATLKPNEVLLDPFCGSGTIISEALLQGQRKIFGSDQSEKAVIDSKTNIDWFLKNYPDLQNTTINITGIDATKLSETFSPASVDAVVTEPYLGKPLHGNEPIESIEAQAAELLKLYTAAFLQFKKILRPGGRVVFIIPQFITKSFPVIISSKLISMVEKMGFAVEPLLPKNIFTSPFVLYRRSDQHVGREIWRFRLK